MNAVAALIFDRLMEVIAKTNGCDYEEHLQLLTVTFIHPPIPNLDPFGDQFFLRAMDVSHANRCAFVIGVTAIDRETDSDPITFEDDNRRGAAGSRNSLASRAGRRSQNRAGSSGRSYERCENVTSQGARPWAALAHVAKDADAGTDPSRAAKRLRRASLRAGGAKRVLDRRARPRVGLCGEARRLADVTEPTNEASLANAGRARECIQGRSSVLRFGSRQSLACF